jgi:hypothetical protein
LRRKPNFTSRLSPFVSSQSLAQRFASGGDRGRRVDVDRSGRCAWAEAPHAVGEDDQGGAEDDEAEGFGGVGQDEGEGVHGGVEDGDSEKVAAGAVIKPSEKDGDGQKEDDADLEVADPGAADAAREIEGRVPERPGKPNEQTGEERRKPLLEAGKKESAPAGFCEGGGEEETVQKRDAAVSGRHPEFAVVLRPDKSAMEEMHDGGGDEQDGRKKEKCDSLPAPIGGMDESVKEFADAGVAREGAGKNPRGNHGEECDKQIVADGRGGVDTAQLVICNIDGRGEDPKDCEGEKTSGEPLGHFSLAAARQENGGDGRATGAEGQDVFAGAHAGTQLEGDDPDKPGEGVGEDEERPSLFFHIARDISPKGKDGNRNRRDEKRPRDRATKVECAAVRGPGGFGRGM